MQVTVLCRNSCPKCEPLNTKYRLDLRESGLCRDHRRISTCESFHWDDNLMELNGLIKYSTTAIIQKLLDLVLVVKKNDCMD